MREKEQILVSKHHKKFYMEGAGAMWKGNIRGELMQTLTPLYCMGTRAEIEAYLHAHQVVHDAIPVGLFKEIPDSEPDTICNACVKLDCGLSSVHRCNLSADEFWTRANVQNRVIEDLNRRMNHYLTNPSTLMKANEFSIQRMSELLEE